MRCGGFNVHQAVVGQLCYYAVGGIRIRAADYCTFGFNPF